MPADPQSFNCYEVWRKVFLHPTELSFREILADPKFHIFCEKEYFRGREVDV